MTDWTLFELDSLLAEQRGATCAGTRRCRARVGDRLFTPPTVTQAFTLERSGDGWIITSLR